MAAAGFNSSPFILPNAFPEPGEVMANAIQNKRQDEQIKQQTAYRQQKDAEADQWKKLDLIQDLTDLSKHQTGSDVANAVGNQHASRILQKYTQAAPNMSPNELMAKVQQEMSGLITGMDAMKDELDLSDQELKLIKQNYPGINISQAAQMKRADILSRRMKGDQFVNPLEVQPSDIDFSNPEVLSEFVSDDSGLIKAITNPQGSEAESVLMGKQGDYTKFEGKLNYWKKPNYDRTQFNSEGFYSGKEIPTFVTKGTTLPSDALPASNGKPFNIIDKDVLDQFTSDATQRLGLLAATKRRYKDYAKFSPQEKEYAQRNVLFDMVETLDPSQLHPTQNVRPQVTSIRNYSGGGTKPSEQINLTEQPDVGGGYKDITSMTGGIKTSVLPDGKSFNAELVYYNSSTKKVKYIEYVSKDDKGKYGEPKWKEVSLTKFKQDVKTSNPQIDMKFLDGLENPITGTKQDTPKPSTSKMVTMVLPDGRKGQIPEDKVDQFLKDNPKAKRQ